MSVTWIYHEQDRIAYFFGAVPRPLALHEKVPRLADLGNISVAEWKEGLTLEHLFMVFPSSK